MDARRWERVKEVFAAAVDRPDADRRRFVQEETGDDTEVAGEVLAMLDGHERAGGFLRDPPALPALDLSGRRIGPYLLAGEVGHGGMGTVYRAVRDDDAFQKTVAVKVVRGGDEGMFRRLEQERRILARLQHPNIATILDGGRTEEGLPYLVMDFVDGEAIDVYCRTRRLDVRARLQLFRTVCDAVSHAHRNLVIHRDLKPANILVTGDGQPRLLDFGIAKVLAGEADPDEAATVTRIPIMTPAYASPEQVRGEPVTTSTDVYSLGIVLYELLTGVHPQPVDAESLAEIVEQICNREPAAASVALRSADAPPPVTAAQLVGDLDVILREALRKEPARRYSSVAALSEDVGRYLEGRPLRARPDTLAYRARKFVGRNRAAVAAAAFVLLSLVAGIVATAREARIAEQHRARADRRFAEARAVARSFIFDIDPEIRHLAGATTARRKIVENGLVYLDRLRADSGGDPDLLAEIAHGYNRIGDILGNPDMANLGDSDGARASYDKGAALAREALALQPGHPEARQSLWSALIGIGDLEAKRSGAAEGLRFFREALVVIDRSIAQSPDDVELVRNRLATLSYVARTELQAGDRAAALTHFEEVRVATQAFRQAHPEHADVARDILIDQFGLITGLLDQEPERALEAAFAGLAMAESAAAAAPDSGEARRDLSVALQLVGYALNGAGRHAEAIPHLERAIAIVRALGQADPDDARAKNDLVGLAAVLGDALAGTGRREEALARYREALASAEAVAAAEPGVMARRRVIGSLLRVGDAELVLGHRAAAIQAFERALALDQELERTAGGDALDQSVEQIRARLARARSR